MISTSETVETRHTPPSAAFESSSTSRRYARDGFSEWMTRPMGDEGCRRSSGKVALWSAT